MEITGRTAVVTGAGHGIGAALAQRLVEGGARVVLGDLDAGAVREITTQLYAASPGSAVGVPGDVSTEAGVDALVDAAEQSFGPVDLFFANAGVGCGQGLEATEEDWSLAWDVNVMAHVRAARRLVPGWLERGEGYFFSTASAAGLLTQIGSPVYSVTKHGALAFAEWLRVTYGDRGIHVSCLCPMGVDTALLRAGEEAENDDARRSNAAVRNAGQVITPLECADRVLETVAEEGFLCLPHPEVLTMYGRKATDYDRWIGGMQRFRESLG